MTARFRLVAVCIALAAALVWVAAFTLPPISVGVHTPSLPQQDWGHVRAYDGAYLFMLGPNTDERKKYELGLGRVSFSSAGVIVADDERMTNGVVLEGKPMGKCGYHWQGQGVNVIVAIGKCVPGWATVTGYDGHAAEWVRVENLGPKPRVVVVKYG